MSFTGHNRDLESLGSLADAAKVVVEGKHNIYELVATLQDEDVKSFLKAAACAQREGKSHFMFNGKDYPVTIASDIAKKIADSKASEAESSIEEDEVDPVSIFDTIRGMGEAVRQGTTQENDDIAPETKTEVDGHDGEVEVKDLEKEITKEIVEVHPMRHFSIPELEYYFNEIGMQFVQVEEWLTKEKPSIDTWGVCAVVKNI